MPIVTWDIGVYNRSGVAQNSTSYDGSVTNQYLKHATDLSWTIPLNGVDEFEFSLYLDDPAALLISKKQTVIKVWRHINDTVNSKTRTPAAGTPDFAGIVTSVVKTGSENKMKVKCMSPLWLLQAHFHLLNHRLVTDTSSFGGANYEGGNANDLPWDHSALMFRLIDLINGAFKNSGGDTGIRKPTTAAYSGTGYLAGESLYWPQTIKTSPHFVQRGSNTWANVFDNLMSRAGAPDLAPEYIHTASSANLMYFKTAIVRGQDRSATVNFGYRTGTKYIVDIEESSQVVPGVYGNYLWVVGDGGPNGGNVAVDYDTTSMSANGLYMVRSDVQTAKGTQATELASDKLNVALLADSPIYSIQVSPVVPIYLGIDYFLGDVIMLNASKGALSVTNKKQRIYSVQLSYSDVGVETMTMEISDDFKRKIVS